MRPYPDVNRGRWQVSNAGGTQPLWSRDGRELYFVSSSDTITAVRFSPGADWNPSAPVPLAVITRLGNPIGGSARTYDEGPDGRLWLDTSVRRSMMGPPQTAMHPAP